MDNLAEIPSNTNHIITNQAEEKIHTQTSEQSTEYVENIAVVNSGYYTMEGLGEPNLGHQIQSSKRRQLS